MSGDIPSRGEQRLADALRPFGWTCGPDFWPRYYSDPWVFSLANAVERVTAENLRLRAAIEKLRDVTREGEVPVLGGLATQIWFARRLTEIITPNASLGGEACISRSEMQGEEGES